MSATKEIGGCFACGEHFNLAKLVAFTQNLTIPQAIEFLEDFFNKSYRTVETSKKFKAYGEDTFCEDSISKVALAPFRSGEIVHPYLLRRGFTEEDFKEFKLGWDSNSKRITIPFFDAFGNLLGFSGRAVLNVGDDGYNEIYGEEPKYKIYNHFKAKDYFYPLDHYKTSDTVILVEGLLDAIWMYKCGYTNVLSIISAEVSKAQLEKLKLLSAKKIILMLDNDKAGESGCQKLYDKLKGSFAFERCEFPNGKKDVQDCSKEEIDFMMKNLSVYPKRNFKFYED